MLNHRSSFSQSTTPTAARTPRRRARLGALLASAALGASFLPATPASAAVGSAGLQPATIPTDRPFAMENVHSGLVADVPDWSTAAGTRIVQWPANGGANQSWSATPAAVAYDKQNYTLKSRHSGLCLTRTVGIDRYFVVQQECRVNNYAQYWHFLRSATTPGAYRIMNLMHEKAPLHVTSSAVRADLTLGSTAQPAPVKSETGTGYYLPPTPEDPPGVEWRLKF